MLPRLRIVSNRKLETIVAVTLLVMVGLTIKPSTQTKADSLNPRSDQPQKLQATTTARILQRQKQVRQVRRENYDLAQVPINKTHEDHWRHLLWTTAVVEPREEFVAAALNQILQMTTRSGLADVDVRIIDQAMKVGTQLYLSDPNFYGSVGQRLVETVEQSSDPEWVAVALSGLAQGKVSMSELAQLSAGVKTRFSGWERNIYLQTTLNDIADGSSPENLPPLQDLLSWQIAPRQLHLFVLCRPNREVLCRAVLKDRDGKFVRQSNELWSVPLLLRSIHNLGWNFTRGQTPQGVFRVEGVIPQPDDEYFRAYGQFPLINLYVPFEPGAKQFIPNQAGAFAGSLATYQALLPPTWRNHRPLQQSFWAGKTGRSLFRIHGSGEAVDFFRGKDKSLPDSYNWNPTIGCLSAREIYNEKGQLIHADMPKILQALRMVGGNNFSGYLIVVDVPSDEAQPVSLKQIETMISQARRGGRQPISKARKSTVQRVSQLRSPSTNQHPQAVHPMSIQMAQVSALNQVASGKANRNSPTPLAKPATVELKRLPIAY